MKNRKVFGGIAAILISVVMLAGCGAQTNTTSGTNSVKANDEPLDLTIHMHNFPYVFKDDFPIYKKAAELTNITLHGTASSAATDSNQAFNTMLIADTLPDIIHGKAVNINKAGMDGAMIPLEDLVKQYAPDINKFFEERPDTFKGSLAPDGHLYYIPCVYDKGPAMGWFIRQDWLDKLGLETPKTVDEYYKVLKAFRDNDPNGNGIKDEVPYLNRQKHTKNLYPLFGVSKLTFDIGNDGKIYVPPVTEEYKFAIKQISKWYSEGLIDQEIFSRGSTAREQLFENNTGGATHDWFSSSLSFNDKMKDSVRGFNLVTIDPPANINGKVVNASPRATLSGDGWGISIDNAHAAETMRYFNFWFTEAGKVLNAYGVEGVNYNVVDGKREYVQEAKDYAGGIPSYMASIGSNNIGIHELLDAEIAGMNEGAAEGFKGYIDKDFTIDEFPTLAFTVDENRIVAEKKTAIETYIDEKTQSWIMGNGDIDSEWNEYVTWITSMGINDVANIYQGAYERYLKK